MLIIAAAAILSLLLTMISYCPVIVMMMTVRITILIRTAICATAVFVDNIEVVVALRGLCLLSHWWLYSGSSYFHD